MLNNRGFTLVETLFAFQVYLCIICILAGLSHNISIHNHKLSQLYEHIHLQEEELIQCSDIYEIIEMVLH